MNAALLAERYAEALRTAVGAPEALRETARALEELSALFCDTPLLRFVLCNPTLDARKRMQLLETALAGVKASPPIANLARLLLRGNRMPLLPLITQRFESRIDDWLKRVEVRVVSAVPLTSELRGQLVRSLENFTGKTVRMRCETDLDIIGGLVVYMYGVFFDFSHRARLAKLEEKLLTEEALTYGD